MIDVPTVVFYGVPIFSGALGVLVGFGGGVRIGHKAGYASGVEEGFQKYAHEHRPSIRHAYRKGFRHGTALFNTPRELEGSE